jgi:lysophospholipase L1-like esterase
MHRIEQIIRRRFVFAMVYTCIILAPNSFVSGQTTRIACIGNSITAGGDAPVPGAYPSVFAGLLGDGYEVLNCGVGGIKADNYQAHPSMQQALDFNPQIVTVMLGTNDARDTDWKSRLEFESAYQKILDALKALGSAPVIFLCFPPPAAKNAASINNATLTSEIIPAIRSLAQANGLDTIDLHSPFTGLMELFPDGIHPNAAATMIIARTIFETLDPSAKDDYPADNTAPQSPSGLHALNVTASTLELCWEAAVDEG